jgi:hypothetical protein
VYPRLQLLRHHLLYFDKVRPEETLYLLDFRSCRQYHTPVDLHWVGFHYLYISNCLPHHLPHCRLESLALKHHPHHLPHHQLLLR